MSFYSDLLVLPEALDAIKAIGTERMPSEACGVLLPNGEVIEMTNHSEQPEDSYILEVNELHDKIEPWLAELPDHVDKLNLIVWHTHPRGGIGPSKGDLDERIAGVRYLVVSLPNGEAVQY